MRDTELYRQILGIESPWEVETVQLNIKEGRVDVQLKHKEGLKWPCPECGNALSIYDHAEERTWRHLDTCQFQTLIHARVPRVDCDEHGVRQVKVPWAEARSRFTLLMERLVIDVLQETATVEGARRLLGLSWDEVHSVMERAVKRGQKRKKRKPRSLIGVDEKSFKKRHRYMTVVCDLAEGTVEHVSEGRKAESLEEYYSSLTAEEREGIEAVAMDMSRAWAIKETLRGLWSYTSRTWAWKFFKSWYSWASRSRLKPVRDVARMVRDHLEGILNYCRAPVTNATAEGLNSRITAVKQRACGFRNPDNFKTAIYFFC